MRAAAALSTVSSLVVRTMAVVQTPVARAANANGTAARAEPGGRPAIARLRADFTWEELAAIEGSLDRIARADPSFDRTARDAGLASILTRLTEKRAAGDGVYYLALTAPNGAGLTMTMTAAELRRCMTQAGPQGGGGSLAFEGRTYSVHGMLTAAMQASDVLRRSGGLDLIDDPALDIAAAVLEQVQADIAGIGKVRGGKVRGPVHDDPAGHRHAKGPTRRIRALVALLGLSQTAGPVLTVVHFSPGGPRKAM